MCTHAVLGADAGSDHYLVMSMLKLCLRKAPAKKNRPMKYNIPRLKQDEVLKAFVVEIKNQFQLLSAEEIDHPQVEGKWNQIKDVYCNMTKNNLGYPLSHGGESKRGKPSSQKFSTPSQK